MDFTGERMIPDFNVGQDMYFQHLSRYIFASKLCKGKKVLDIACGSGYGSKILLDAGADDVIGVDISQEAVDFCAKRYREENLNFLTGSVDNIPVSDKSIDIIVSFETLEHVDEETQKVFLKEVGRVLKEDGLMIISTPNSKVYPKGNEFHIRELDDVEFSDFLYSKFKIVNFFYQDNVESSYIISEKNETSVNKFFVIDKLDLKNSMYIIAVCANADLPKIDNEVGITNIKPSEIIHALNLEVAKKQKMIENLEKKNEFMESSKFWKIRELYIKRKNSLFK